jgi:hypothetical protein
VSYSDIEKESTVLQEREKAEKQEQAVLTTSQHITQPTGVIARLAETREETASALHVDHKVGK